MVHLDDEHKRALKSMVEREGDFTAPLCHMDIFFVQAAVFAQFQVSAAGLIK